MKQRILLVDDEVAVLLTLKAVLEISGFDVDTAASARDAKLKIRKHEYAMVITDMRMENDVAGAEVIQAARAAKYLPAIALLTAFPVAEEDWQELDTDKVEVLMKPMQTRVLLQQIGNLLEAHQSKLAASKNGHESPGRTSALKVAAKKTISQKAATGKREGRKTTAKKASAKPART